MRDLGDGVRAVAHTPDGIVEAIEPDGTGFALGVQWELQESWRYHERFLAVVASFVAAARDAAARTA